MSIPVFCVGNYHVGGAGKTPTVLALAATLRDMGERPYIVSRGFGGKLGGPVVVNVKHHTAADVGDEPLMMAARTPVIVARNRADGALLAQSMGASIILLDDGFQNPSIEKDLSLIVIDSFRGLGNGKVFPAGPLRAPLSAQLVCTDALIVVGDGPAADKIAAAVMAQNHPVLRAYLVPDAASISNLQGKSVLAFAGIGDPARFFRMLRANGISVIKEIPFPDHHSFSLRDVDRLISAAATNALTLVTTEKDLVRLQSDKDLAAHVGDVVQVKVTLTISEGNEWSNLVSAALAKSRAA